MVIFLCCKGGSGRDVEFLCLSGQMCDARLVCQGRSGQSEEMLAAQNTDFICNLAWNRLGADQKTLEVGSSINKMISKTMMVAIE